MSYSQSDSERAAVATAWLARRCPKGFIRSNHNFELINRALRGQVYSLDSIDAVVRSLGDMQDGGALVYEPRVVVQTVEVEKAPQQIQTVRHGDEYSDGRRFTHVDSAEDRKKAEQERIAATTGANSPRFQEENANAREAFERICNSYIATRGGRQSFALTSERQAKLRGIRVALKQRDANGHEVLLFSTGQGALARAKDMLAQFDKEDARGDRN